LSNLFLARPYNEQYRQGTDERKGRHNDDIESGRGISEDEPQVFKVLGRSQEGYQADESGDTAQGKDEPAVTEQQHPGQLPRLQPLFHLDVEVQDGLAQLAALAGLLVLEGGELRGQSNVGLGDNAEELLGRDDISARQERQFGQQFLYRQRLGWWVHGFPLWPGAGRSIPAAVG
jgi:hypothetical protein